MNFPEMRPLFGMDDAVMDDKGRIVIGQKKRDRIGQNFALYLGKFGCVMLVPEPAWHQMLYELSRIDPADECRNRFCCIAFGCADDELNFDNRGRILIPRSLRDAARLSEHVLVIGCYDHVEIWSPEEYKNYEMYPDTYHVERREAFDEAYRAMLNRVSRPSVDQPMRLDF